MPLSPLTHLMKGYVASVLTEHGNVLRFFRNISEVLPALLEELVFHFCLLISLGEALQLQLNFFFFFLEGRGEGMVKITLFL